jgi:hypothetical protein
MPKDRDKKLVQLYQRLSEAEYYLKYRSALNPTHAQHLEDYIVRLHKKIDKLIEKG